MKRMKHIYTRYWVSWREAGHYLNPNMKQFAEGNLSEAKAFAIELSQNTNLEVRLLLQTEHEILPRS